MTVCIAVDDNDDGMEIKIEEDTPEMAVREKKPQVYPRAKALVPSLIRVTAVQLLTDWATSTAKAKVVLAKQEMLATKRKVMICIIIEWGIQMEAQKAALEEVRFQASQCLAKGAIEMQSQVLCYM